jgi:hypothetical protein
VEIGGLRSEASRGKSVRRSLKKCTKSKRTEGAAQVVALLLSQDFQEKKEKEIWSFVL